MNADECAIERALAAAGHDCWPYVPGVTFTMPCPDCRERNGCRVDCGVHGCACRGTCEECELRIARSLRIGRQQAERRRGAR